jgi:hypothetical protein
MLPSNIDWFETIVSIKKCWSICEGDQMEFKPHASCIYFGSISSYVNGGEVYKDANGILWKWEVQITQFDIMAQDIQDVS